jgi:lysophospholipase L1-like esterase
VFAGIVVASVVITTILAWMLSVPAHPPAAARTVRTSSVAVESPAPVSTPIRPVVLAIGDSVMKGYGDPVGDSWLDIIAKKQNWNLIDRSCDGAGFIKVAPADCGMNFAGIISGTKGLSPDYVIITGSANDFGTNNAQLNSVTGEAIEQLRTQFPRASIIGLPVAWGDQQPPGKVAVIDSQIAAAMQSVNGTFVDFGTPLRAHPELMQADHLHPLPAGQIALENDIEQSIASAGIVI